MLRALIAACLWYCFDDALAELVGNPDVGSIEFLHVFCACWLCAVVAGPPIRIQVKNNTKKAAK